MMKRRVREHARGRAAGFTLVEILVVLAIIGMLSALITVAVSNSMQRARESAASTEMALLQNAMNEFRAKYGGYPPSLGTPLDDSNPTNPNYVYESTAQRQSRIIRFLNKAFPRYNPLTVPNSTWNSIRWEIGAATLKTPKLDIAPNSGVNIPSGLTGLTGGALNCCDIETLDPAEALVLWLGGLPRQRQGDSGRVLFELTGFSVNPTSPFRLPISQAEYNATVPPADATWRNQGFVGEQRTPVIFQFDTARLGDVDGDNWPEYYPKTSGAVPTRTTYAGSLLPYVYFSSAEYALHPAYPYYDSGDANVDDPWSGGVAQGQDHPSTPVNEGDLRRAWGLAKPFAAEVPANATTIANLNNWQIVWVQPDGFQIMCAGLDNFYGIQANEDAQWTRTFPQGRVYGGSAYYSLGAGMQDNLQSFTTGRLESELRSQ